MAESFKIEKVELSLVRLPMKDAFLSSESSVAYQEHIIVKVCGGGLVGWGECACQPDPFYTEEYVGSCLGVLKDFLIPMIVGKDWNSIEDFQKRYSRVQRNHIAKAGLEMAVCDLMAKTLGVSLSELLGGQRKAIDCGISLGIENSVEKLLETIHQRYAIEGYKRIKLKVSVENDISVIKAVRKVYPKLPLMIDGNSDYTLKDINHLKRFDEFNLMMIEQPLSQDDFLDHAVLQKELETPICLDESIVGIEHARQAIENGSCRIINIKPQRVGGLFNAKRIHDYCLSKNIAVWCGGMHEFGIGRAANIAISSLIGFTIPGDVCSSDVRYEEDVLDTMIIAEKGVIQVPNSPGMGFEVNEAFIKKHSTCVETFTV